MTSDAALQDPFRAPDEEFIPARGLPRQYISYGGVLPRGAAFFIDYLFLLVNGLWIGYVVRHVGERAILSAETVTGLQAVGWLLLAAVYFSVMESSTAQGTFGKIALGLQVTDSRGQPIGFARALGRFVAKLLSFLLLGAGFLIAPFSPRRSTLHDLLARTQVARLK